MTFVNIIIYYLFKKFCFIERKRLQIIEMTNEMRFKEGKQ